MTENDTNTKDEEYSCPTDGCDGEMYLAVPEAHEWCCDDCRTAYIRVQEQGWVGGVEV